MARFIVVHRLPDVAIQEEVIAAGRAVLAALPKDTLWLRGWVVPEDDRLLCEWEAPDEEAVRASLRETELFPVEAIYPVAVIDPAWFKG